MAESTLEVRSLDAFYGGAHILHDLGLQIGAGATAILGRNGMGKTTLCRAIMGIVPPRTSGSIRFGEGEIRGRPAHGICRAGIGYVPQGRRLFPSLTTSEHLRMIDGRLVRRGEWSIERVYELFPALAERRDISGARLSGGEQQMLAIGRTLLTNPRLLVMDEPSEGLAPTIVDTLIDTCRVLVDEGMALLVVEQNLRVATAIADRVLIMVTGEVVHEATSAELLSDEAAQRRFLGVEPTRAVRGSAVDWDPLFGHGPEEPG